MRAGPGDVVYDLGCNDGRVCITAARDPGGGGQGQTSGARRAGCELRSQLTTSISPSPSDWSTWTSLATPALVDGRAKPPRRGDVAPERRGASLGGRSGASL